MKKIYQGVICLLAITAISSVSAVHVEISNQYLGKLLSMESSALQGKLDKYWKAQGLPYQIELDYNTISTKQGGDRHSIDF